MGGVGRRAGSSPAVRTPVVGRVVTTVGAGSGSTKNLPLGSAFRSRDSVSGRLAQFFLLGFEDARRSVHRYTQTMGVREPSGSDPWVETFGTSTREGVGE